MYNIVDELEIDGYLLKNYIILNENEQKIALNFRNENRIWMINQNIISLSEHKSWISKLKDNKQVLYFLVFKNYKPFMSIDFHDINFDKREAYWGYFLGNDKYQSEVLKIEKIIIYIAFEVLKLNNLLCINDASNKVINIHKFFSFKEIGKEFINDRKFIKMKLTKDDYLKSKRK